MPFILDFEFNTEGYESVWDAHSAMVKIGRLHPSDITHIEVGRNNPIGWPTLSITFASKDAAQAYTLAYLGYDEHTTSPSPEEIDKEIHEYTRFGRFEHEPEQRT